MVSSRGHRRQDGCGAPVRAVAITSFLPTVFYTVLHNGDRKLISARRYGLNRGVGGPHRPHLGPLLIGGGPSRSLNRRLHLERLSSIRHERLVKLSIDVL